MTNTIRVDCRRGGDFQNICSRYNFLIWKYDHLTYVRIDFPGSQWTTTVYGPKWRTVIYGNYLTLKRVIRVSILTGCLIWSRHRANLLLNTWQVRVTQEQTQNEPTSIKSELVQDGDHENQHGKMRHFDNNATGNHMEFDIQEESADEAYWIKFERN